jgi:hypothetical protein
VSSEAVKDGPFSQAMIGSMHSFSKNLRLAVADSETTLPDASTELVPSDSNNGDTKIDATHSRVFVVVHLNFVPDIGSTTTETGEALTADESPT